MGCSGSSDRKVTVTRTLNDEKFIVSPINYRKIINSTTEELTVLVREQLKALEDTAANLSISDSVIFTLGLAFGRASNTFKAVQELVNEVVTRIGVYTLALPPTSKASEIINDKREQLVLLSVAYWNNCMAKGTEAIPCLTPTQRLFLDLKESLMQNNMTEDERMIDAHSTLVMLVATNSEDVLIQAMLRLSVHYYKLHERPDYKTLMLTSIQNTLKLPASLASSLPFRLSVICLLIHTEWDTGNMPADTLHQLLMTPFLPDWMHSYMMFEPCPLPSAFMQHFQKSYDIGKYDYHTRNLLSVKWP